MDSIYDRIILEAEESGKLSALSGKERTLTGKEWFYMGYLIIALLLIGLLSPSGSKPKKQNKKKQKTRPWYDVTVDDMIKYDIFFDD